MRIEIDEDRCQGHALCAMYAPNLFDNRADDGHAVAIPGEVPDSEAEAARRAVAGCPEQAITLR
jgi:ferredoxin